MPPANDAFANREVISGASGSVSGTLTGATSDGASYDGSRPSVWYEFTPPTTGTYKLTFTQTTPGSSGVLGSLSVKYVATPTGVYYVSGVGVDAVNTPHFSHAELIAGTAYAFLVSCFSSIYEGDFTIDWELDSQPGNDDFANATDLGSLSGTLVDETNIGATEEVNDRYYPDSRGLVWYKVTLPVGSYTKSRFKITVDQPTTPSGDYRGEYGSNLGDKLSQVVLERQQTGGTEFVDYRRFNHILPSRFDRWITVTPGETWWIGVGNFNDTPTDYAVVPGNFNLVWDLTCEDIIVGGTPPAYDDIVDARDINLAGETFSVSTIGATNETNETTYNDGSPTGGIWLKLDLTGEPSGTPVTFAVTAQGDGCAVAYFDCWYDADADFVPASPDFSKLEYPATQPGGDTFYDGDLEGTAQTIALDGGFVYYIVVTDWNFSTQGDFDITWGALGSKACPTGVPVGNFDTPAFDQITSHSAHAHFLICAAGATTTVHVDYGTSPTFSSLYETIDLTVPAGNAFMPIDLLLTRDCTGLDAGTTIYVRVRAQNSHGFMASFNSSFITIAEPGTPPANDNIASAQVISGASGSAMGDNWNATEETGEHTALFSVDHTLYGDAPNGTASVWFKWTAPADMDIAFWTVTPDYTNNGREGCWETIISVLDGDTFAATVVAQNESAQGQPPPFAGSQYPHSLVQFHATSGVTYYIAVDCFSGCTGPFGLNWGAPVDAQPVIRNCSIIAVTDTTATFQFDVNPQTPSGGHYWANAYSGVYSLSTDSPHASIAGVDWVTVTAIVTGLTPNTPYGGPYTYTMPTGNGNNLVWVDNPSYPGVDFGTFEICDGFYTLMPVGQFAVCTSDFMDNFTGDDCTVPTNWFPTDGYRLHGNSLAAYVWQEANSAGYTGMPDGGLGQTGNFHLSGDSTGTLTEVAGKQDVGLGAWLARSDADAGTLSLIRVDPGPTETVLDSGSFTLSNGDKLGIRYDYAITTISVWLNQGSGWVEVFSAVDTTYELNPGFAGAPVFSPFFAQSAPVGPPAIDTSILFDLSTYGQVTVDIFPPFSCPVGHDKYGWDFRPDNGQHSWGGPYFGGGGANDYPNPAVACPNWWVNLACHAYGRVDCSADSNTNSGNDGEFQAYMSSTRGLTAALVPFYPTTDEYGADIDAYDSDAGAGLYTWDTDMARKGIDAIQASLDNIAAAFSSQGAFKQAKVGDGGRTSYGVFMPVAVAPGRIDNFVFYYERCAVPAITGPVSFSHIRLHRDQHTSLRSI